MAVIVGAPKVIGVKKPEREGNAGHSADHGRTSRFERQVAIERERQREAPDGYTLEEWIRRCAAASCIDLPPPEPKPEIVRRPRGHHVYRHYDANDVLLYIGASRSALHRLSEHKTTAHWFWQIATVKIEHFATREDAALAETVAIAAELPLYNIERNGKGSRWQAMVCPWTPALRRQCKARHSPPRALCETAGSEPCANCIRDEREDGE
jgi:hypothetical protein